MATVSVTQCLKCWKAIGIDRMLMCCKCFATIHVQCTNLHEIIIQCILASASPLQYLCENCAVFNNRASADIVMQPTTIQPLKQKQIIPVNQIIFEINERQRRAYNVMLYNLKESNNPQEHARIFEDKRKVLEILNSLPNVMLKPDLFKIFRIGAIDENKQRPVKIIFFDKLLANNVLILKKLLPPKLSISIGPDRTPMQRFELNLLREQLNTRKRDGETNLTINFLNGVPQIVVAKQPKKSKKNT